MTAVIFCHKWLPTEGISSNSSFFGVPYSCELVNRIPEKEVVVQRLDYLMAKKWVDGTGVSCITQLTLDAVESMKRSILDDRLSGIQAA